MRAAEYVRVSTDMQQYSIVNQRAAIAEYAISNGFQIVKTYADPAKSGLDINHRPGLQSLIDDVLTGKADFEVILVYDISRWGRFQDGDEAACYEFLCRRAKIQVLYCAEPFPNDGSATSNFMKMVKRTMAAEYVRELSVKVFAGQRRLILHGYKSGGSAGYGLRRQLLDSLGRPKLILQPGEYKSLSTEKVTYTWGPPEEVQVVREIFSMYLDGNMSTPAIAEELNRRGIKAEGGGDWHFWVILHMLKNPKYVGCLVFNRRSQRLGAKSTRNPREDWIVRPKSFPAIIPLTDFERVQHKFAERVCTRSNQRLLDELREYLRIHGKTLPRRGSSGGFATASVYAKRFGSMIEAYKLIGYPWKYMTPESIRQIKIRTRQRMELWAELRNLLRQRRVRFRDASDMLHLEGFGTLRIALGVPFGNVRGTAIWRVNTKPHKQAHALVIARLAADLQKVQDFVFLANPPLGVHSFRVPQTFVRSSLAGYSSLEAVIDSEVVPMISTLDPLTSFACT